MSAMLWGSWGLGQGPAELPLEHSNCLLPSHFSGGHRKCFQMIISCGLEMKRSHPNCFKFLRSQQGKEKISTLHQKRSCKPGLTGPILGQKLHGSNWSPGISQTWKEMMSGTQNQGALPRAGTTTNRDWAQPGKRNQGRDGHEYEMQVVQWRL